MDRLTPMPQEAPSCPVKLGEVVRRVPSWGSPSEDFGSVSVGREKMRAIVIYINQRNRFYSVRYEHNGIRESFKY